ncbi:hypothetical protein [Rhizobium leguminosarum]|uniref:hypothetical protein n=1 Tax=Rhizobium leguminosarum TaxID=384 RepID=UPI0013BD6EA0|nr:hypothetical protein [Rhizobium leguminosarum]NEI65009.1 hypothetical protein [Rhizobium leguminosarum]
MSLKSLVSTILIGSSIVYGIPQAHAFDYTSPLGDEGQSPSEQAPDAEEFGALEEAESDLKSVDCQISQTYEEQWALQDKLRDLVDQQVAQMDRRQAFIDEKLQAYHKELGEKIPNLLKDDANDRLSSVQERKLDRSAEATMRSGGTISVLDQAKKAAFLFEKKAGAIKSIIENWKQVVEKVEDYQNLKRQSGQIDKTHAAFAEIREQLNSNGTLNRSLLHLHATKYEQWTQHGVKLTRTFYGTKSDCSPGENVFDGTWSMSTKVSFHVSGTHLTLLDPEMMEWQDGEACKPNNDMLTYNTPTKAEYRYQFICGSGRPGSSNVITLIASKGTVYITQISEECGSEQICDQPTDDQPGFPLRRLGK